MYKYILKILNIILIEKEMWHSETLKNKKINLANRNRKEKNRSGNMKNIKEKNVHLHSWDAASLILMHFAFNVKFDLLIFYFRYFIHVYHRLINSIYSSGTDI